MIDHVYTCQGAFQDHRITHIPLQELCCRMQVLGTPLTMDLRDKPVQYPYAVPALYQGIYQMGTNETSPTCYENTARPHLMISVSTLCTVHEPFDYRCRPAS